MPLGFTKGMSDHRPALCGSLWADGVIERKYKIPNCQQGYAYLTSLRVCYVDEKDPRKNSVALDLREVDRVEYQVREKVHPEFKN